MQECKGDAVGGKAALILYLHDSRLADAPAAKATSGVIDIPKGEKTATLSLHPDMSVNQFGRKYSEMVELSLYVALDVQSSSLTYADTPVFDVQLGSTVELLVKPKS